MRFSRPTAERYMGALMNGKIRGDSIPEAERLASYLPAHEATRVLEDAIKRLDIKKMAAIGMRKMAAHNAFSYGTENRKGPTIAYEEEQRKAILLRYMKDMAPSVASRLNAEYSNLIRPDRPLRAAARE